MTLSLTSRWNRARRYLRVRPFTRVTLAWLAGAAIIAALALYLKGN